MIKGFKQFILRGNVVELAVAVVIGAAFGTVVTAFTERIIKPLINAVTPAGSPGLGFTIIGGKDSTYVDLAAFVTALINFVLVAAVVYFAIVLPLHRIQRRRAAAEPASPAPPTDVELLAEIRDLLRERSASPDQ